MRPLARIALVAVALTVALANVRAAGPPAARFTFRQVVRQGAARLRTQTLRAITLPAHMWPITKITAAFAHGEPIAGLTPAAATRAALEVSSEHTGVVIGRLAWELHDPWSARGAERSYVKLIGELAAARAKEPALDASVSLDPESLGLQLAAVDWPERERLATAAVLRVARVARREGIPIELDMGTSDAMPHTIAIAKKVVRELGVPVRLAIAARYRSSDEALRDWIALGRETGVRVGVRLVKGSFIESEQPDAINQRGPLLHHYEQLITLALENADALDVAVASQNDGIWEHTQREAARLHADFSMHVIRGVNPELQAKMRAAGRLGRVYVSYGVDAPVMGLTEMLTNWKERRAVARQLGRDID